MNTAAPTLSRKEWLVNLLFSAFALLFIIFAPALSHLASVPLWMIEPMRLMVVLALVHMHRANAYALALVLPLTAFLVSGHPEFPKMLIIKAELVLNVFLFGLFTAFFRRAFLPMLASILVSKVFCYLLYLVVFPVAFFLEEANTDFLLIQLAVTLALSLYAGLLAGKRA